MNILHTLNAQGGKKIPYILAFGTVIRMWEWLRDKTLRQNILGQESELEELRETSCDGNNVFSTLITRLYQPS